MFHLFCNCKREIERLTKLAYYDMLTTLPNRLMFHEHSDDMMQHSQLTDEPMSVFLIDLDNFKHINDTYGHDIGDIVLKQIADRIDAVRLARCQVAQSVHKNHNCQCFAARLGGDEFVVLFEHMDKHEAEIIAQQTISTLKEPIIINGKDIVVSASLGVSIYPWDASNMSALLKASDLAMYTAKEKGKDQVAFHESYMNSKIERRVEAELLIRNIIDTGNIDLSYQPIFSVSDERIVGFESLLRNNNPNGIVFSPMELISVAEEANLIIALGAGILERACSFGVQCLDAGFDLNVSVNVSSPQLADPNFYNIVENVLEKTQLPAQNLVIEMTETILMSNFEKCASTLNRLKELGIGISIDDFGKGYSSFNYLQSLPISRIKIDISFVQQLGNKTANTIVQGIISMADALDMVTCAEGVETELQIMKLKEFGCECAQGHFKYPALNTQQFFEMLEHEKVN